MLVIGIFGLLAINVWTALRQSGRGQVDRSEGGPVIDGTAEEVTAPGRAAAETLRRFEDVRQELKAAYPAVFSMLGGYLNAHAIEEAGGIEASVAQMIEDWQSRGAEVSRELTRMLAENEQEAEVRAIVLAACDADFEQEGYRKWLTWLLGKFNSLS